LEGACAPLIQELGVDEIFGHRLPALRGAEPHSLAGVLGQRGPDRSGGTWPKALQAWPPLRHVSAANGTGLPGGLAGRAAQRRRRGGTAAPEVSLDVSHTRREGGQALGGEGSAAERVWEEAEQAERALELPDKTLAVSCRKPMYSWNPWEAPAMKLT